VKTLKDLINILEKKKSYVRNWFYIVINKFDVLVFVFVFDLLGDV